MIFAEEDRSFALATKAMVLVAGVVALFLLTRGSVRMGAGLTLAAIWVITVAAMFASAALVQFGLESFMRVLAGAQAGEPRGYGAGLGLSTVHGIVSQNGGTLEVMSEPGKGSVFLVRWPVSPRA